MEVIGSCGNKYEVGWTNCTCPHFKFRCLSLGLICKHIEKFRVDYPSNKPDNIIPDVDLTIFLKGLEANKVPYNNDILEKLIRAGEIFYNARDDKCYLFE